jgi:UDP-N-acetylglucosamine 2-epimerase (non-hydrolysing)
MRLATVFGTRPEAIKLARVALALRNSGANKAVRLTGQHREMLDHVVRLFGIEPVRRRAGLIAYRSMHFERNPA